MASPSFRLVFAGEIGEGRDAEQVKQAFAELFGLAGDEVEVLFSGKRAVLKRDLDAEKAETYRARLAQVGAVCVVEPEAEVGEAVVAAASDEPADSSPQPEPGGLDSGAAAAAAAGPAGGLYAPPSAALEVERGGPADLHEPRSLPAGRGWGWIVDGFRLFAQDWLMWIVAFIVYMLLMMVLGFIPLAANVLFPILIGGFMLGCREADTGGSFRVGHIFAGFDKYGGPLAAVGGLFLLGSIVISIGALIVMFMVGGGMAAMGSLANMEADPDAGMAALGVGMLLLFLVIMALMLPLMMAIWFAPALVVHNGQTAVQAMLLSFKGCLRNILPFLIYGVIGFVLMILSMFTLGLAFLVLGPIFTASMYTSYREIFIED